MTIYELRAVINATKKTDEQTRSTVEAALLHLAKLADDQLEALDSKRRIGRTGVEALKPTAAETILREILR